MEKDLIGETEYALSLIKQGREEGVDLLYRRMGGRMLIAARGIVRDPFYAEDVVQESLIKIVGNVSRYKSGGNACAWIYKIVRNTALNHLKKESGHLPENIDEYTALADCSVDLQEQVQSRLTVDRLLGKLSPPIVRKLIYMKYFLGMTVREIAKETGKSKSYVSKEIIKAEEFMKNCLEED